EQESGQEEAPASHARLPPEVEVPAASTKGPAGEPAAVPAAPTSASTSPNHRRARKITVRKETAPGGIHMMAPAACWSARGVVPHRRAPAPEIGYSTVEETVMRAPSAAPASMVT